MLITILKKLKLCNCLVIVHMYNVDAFFIVKLFPVNLNYLYKLYENLSKNY